MHRLTGPLFATPPNIVLDPRSSAQALCPGASMQVAVLRHCPSQRKEAPEWFSSKETGPPEDDSPLEGGYREPVIGTADDYELWFVKDFRSATPSTPRTTGPRQAARRRPHGWVLRWVNGVSRPDQPRPRGMPKRVVLARFEPVVPVLALQKTKNALKMAMGPAIGQKMAQKRVFPQLIRYRVGGTN